MLTQLEVELKKKKKNNQINKNLKGAKTWQHNAIFAAGAVGLKVKVL